MVRGSELGLGVGWGVPENWLWEQQCRRRLDVSPSPVGKELSNI